MGALIEAGASSYQILVPGRRRAAEWHAAECLQDALWKMTGVRLPVRSARLRVRGWPAIILGPEDAAPPVGLWDTDSYEILPDGCDLILRGTAGRGTLYAVGAFLESLGARFYGPDRIALPHLRRVDMPARPVRSTASFSYRHVFYPTAQVPEWAVRWKLNVHDGRDARWGPNARAHSWGHSFDALLPGRDHFDEHPEYFSLVDGVRRSHREPYNHQLCCTNPDVADLVSEGIARWIEQHPDRRIFAVGQNDGAGQCECPDCAAVDEREGTHAGQVLTLVNRVAERFPDRIIATLAYAWSVEPPREVRALDNVLIVLCHNEGCYTHGLAECDHNAPFLRRLEGWRERANHILIWDYYVNYHSYLMPTPNLRRIERDLRTYRDVGVAGMFCQGSAERGGQFAGVRQYLLGKMLWDPDQDAWPIVEDWVTGVYGRAAGAHVLDYLALLHDHVRDDDVHMTSFGSGQRIQPHVFTGEILRRGQKMWDAAERAASEEEAPRVFAARAPEMCSRLFHVRMDYAVEDALLRPDPPPDEELRDRFVQAALQGGAACLRENAGAPEDFARNYGRSYPVAVIENDLLRAVIVPAMGGRLFSLRWKDGDLELLHVDDLLRVVNYMPCHSGCEFSAGAAGLPSSAEEEFDLVEATAERALLELDLAGQLAVRSEFALDGPALRLSHAVRNTGAEPITVSPRLHPEWHYRVFGDAAQLAFRTPAGDWRTMPVNPEGRRSRDLAFSGDGLPMGRWRVESGVRPFALEERFDPAELESARLRLYAPDGSLNLELYFQPTTLAPGEERTYGMTCAFGASACPKDPAIPGVQ